MTGDPWREYLAAAQRLDAVRRGAVTAAGQQAQGAHAAREELTGVRARLAPQQSRLRELGVPEEQLVPSEPEIAAAGRTMTGGPEAVLAALRQARATADAADAAMPDEPANSPSGSAGWPRALLVYGPLAVVALLLLACLGAGVARLAG